MAFEDTLAVTLAGWFEPVSRAARRVYGGNATDLLEAVREVSPEHSAFTHAVAGHALDYDDVHLTSVTHPSVVLVPVLLAMSAAQPTTRARILSAYAVGLGINIALGSALGFLHYERGWHATSTLGPIAGAAALSHLLQLTEAQTRSALALAAAQSAGLQRNFGSMAKPIQAGNAAAAAVRAALLAAADVNADQDIFGPKGVFDLYGDGEARAPAAITIDPGSVSRKLYPCCYATHRLIAAAVSARRQLPSHTVPASADIRVSVPFGTMRPLRIYDPRDGAGARFCAAYTIAVGLHSGEVGLADFLDEAVSRPTIRELMGRIHVSEEQLLGDMPIGLDHGIVRLDVVTGSTCAASAQCAEFPGSPAAPASRGEMSAKVADCLAVFNQHAATKVSAGAFAGVMNARLGLALNRMSFKQGSPGAVPPCATPGSPLPPQVSRPGGDSS